MTDTKEKPTCEKCKFYVADVEVPTQGRCFRFPPQRGMQLRIMQDESKPESPPVNILIPDCDFALTQPRFWCGEFVQAEASA